MTQEQKAKAYDESVNKLRHFMEQGIDPLITMADVQDFFPELKESMDEKIRKVLIELVKCNERCGYFMINNITTSSMLAWLEKQGNQNLTIPKWKYKSDNNPLLKDSIILNKYGCVAKSPSGSLVSDVWVIDYDELAKLPKEVVKQDKLEFHEGDWIIQNDKCSNPLLIQGQVIDVNGYYRCCDQSGETVTLTVFNVHNNFHLWSIKDAKDGDILVTAYNEHPFIFKGCLDHNHQNSPVAYCGIDADECFFKCEVKFNFWWTDEKVCPATKEQRDILLNAIYEAGYTFDFEKKELKKIEQKPDEWSEKYKEAIEIGVIALDDLEPNDTYYGYTMPFGEAINWLKLLKDKVQPKQKDWSKEDEMKFADILALLRGGENCHYNTPDLFEWFKSLKDRYTWKPSEKQIKALEHFVRSIGESGFASPYDNKTALIYSLLEQLKNIKV